MKKKSIKSSFRKKTKKRCKVGGSNYFNTNNILPLGTAIKEVNQIGHDLLRKKEWIEFIYKNKNLMLVVGGIVISSMAITIIKQHRNISRQHSTISRQRSTISKQHRNISKQHRNISQSKVQINTLENNLNTSEAQFKKLETDLNNINIKLFHMIGYGIINFNSTNSTNSTNLCELTPTQKFHNCICYKY
jgi:seryl-tRNA synthetase